MLNLEHGMVFIYQIQLILELIMVGVDYYFYYLNENGLMILGVPIGKDALVWNAHRVYGEIRLPLLINKFREIKWYGKQKYELFNNPLGNNGHQPVIVLKKLKNKK